MYRHSGLAVGLALPLDVSHRHKARRRKRSINIHTGAACCSGGTRFTKVVAEVATATSRGAEFYHRTNPVGFEYQSISC